VLRAIFGLKRLDRDLFVRLLHGPIHGSVEGNSRAQLMTRPFSLVTSRYSQPWGLSGETLVTLPVKLIGFSSSYSAWKE
jgi:hypothetical protein